jgi:hypothetical protein
MFDNKKSFLILCYIQLFHYSQNCLNDTSLIMINHNINHIISLTNQDLSDILQTRIWNIEKYEKKIYTGKSFIYPCILNICIDIILILFTFLQGLKEELVQFPISCFFFTNRKAIVNLFSIDFLDEIIKECEKFKPKLLYILIHFLFISIKYICMILHKFNKNLFSLRFRYIIMYIFFITNILLYFFFHLILHNFKDDQKIKATSPENEYKTCLLILKYLQNIQNNIDYFLKELQNQQKLLNQEHNQLEIIITEMKKINWSETEVKNLLLNSDNQLFIFRSKKYYKKMSRNPI